MATTDDEVIRALREAGASLVWAYEGWHARVDWARRAGVMGIVAGCSRWQAQGGRTVNSANRARTEGAWELPSGLMLEVSCRLTTEIVASCVVTAGLQAAEGDRAWFVQMARGNVEGGRPTRWSELIDAQACDLLDDAEFGQDFPDAVAAQATAARLLLDEVDRPESYADVMFLVGELVSTLLEHPDLVVTAEALDREPSRVVAAPVVREEGSRGW